MAEKLAMNAKMFDEDFTALFDDDYQFDDAIHPIFQEMELSKKENRMEDVLAIWEKVAGTEAEIDAYIKQQPEFQKLHKSIGQERKKLALAEAEAKQAMEEQQQLEKKLAEKRQKMHKLFTQQIVNVPDQVVDDMAAVVLAYRRELIEQKKKIDAKQALLEQQDDGEGVENNDE